MKILVIEDERKIANNLKRGLEQEAFTVDISYNGDEGYDLASTEDYDVIILDLMLPGVSGQEICENLRNEGNQIPILMLTAKSTTEDKVNGLNCGADDYLTKPFSFEELLARVRALLRRPAKIEAEILECADLKLDIQNLSVARAGTSIELSKTEFILLEYLLRNKNTVVPKQKIMERVWDFDSDVLPNTVEVYIGYLRKKIEKPFKDSPKLIKTVRGMGYKIVEPSITKKKEEQNV